MCPVTFNVCIEFNVLLLLSVPDCQLLLKVYSLPGFGVYLLLLIGDIYCCYEYLNDIIVQKFIGNIHKGK
jgi:hypothetical protein